MYTMPSGYWPKSRPGKAFLFLYMVSPFALIGTFIPSDHWIVATIPSASLTLGWLGRVLMQLDDDQQPGAGTSIGIPRLQAETDGSLPSSTSSGIAPRTGPSGQN